MIGEIYHIPIMTVSQKHDLVTTVGKLRLWTCMLMIEKCQNFCICIHSLYRVISWMLIWQLNEVRNCLCRIITPPHSHNIYTTIHHHIYTIFHHIHTQTRILFCIPIMTMGPFYDINVLFVCLYKRKLKTSITLGPWPKPPNHFMLS